MHASIIEDNYDVNHEYSMVKRSRWKLVSATVRICGISNNISDYRFVSHTNAVAYRIFPLALCSWISVLNWPWTFTLLLECIGECICLCRNYLYILSYRWIAKRQSTLSVRAYSSDTVNSSLDYFHYDHIHIIKCISCYKMIYFNSHELWIHI